MKNLIAALSIVSLVSIGLITFSQSDDTPGRGTNISDCQLCVDFLVETIKSTVGQIIIGGSNNTDIAKTVVVVIGVPSERAGGLVADYNQCCLDNGCTNAPLLVVR